MTIKQAQSQSRPHKKHSKTYKADNGWTVVSGHKVYVFDENGGVVWEGSHKLALIALANTLQESDDLNRKLLIATGGDEEMMGS